jgi:hypothetical protein
MLENPGRPQQLAGLLRFQVVPFNRVTHHAAEVVRVVNPAPLPGQQARSHFPITLGRAPIYAARAFVQLGGFKPRQLLQ